MSEVHNQVKVNCSSSKLHECPLCGCKKDAQDSFFYFVCLECEYDQARDYDGYYAQASKQLQKGEQS